VCNYNRVKLSKNALILLEHRYLLKDEEGKVVETPEQMFRRVAHHVAQADLLYDRNSPISEIEERFFEAMSNLEFLPNSPTLMNAGTQIGQLSACFVLPVEDSMKGIFDALKNMAIIHQSGGGTGFSFSHLRPKDDVVKSTGGIASGPISFMRIFDEATEVIKQGGRRRGANIGILRVDHPDIIEFIRAKENGDKLKNFNISVGVTDKFMNLLKKGKDQPLINPRTGKVVKKIKADEILNQMVKAAWKTGDPGAIFLDTINRDNPTPHIAQIEATNPCGEQPLLPYESCNLGSINLSKMVSNGRIDWEKFETTIQMAVHFLDNVIDINKYPLPEIEKITKGNRKIGLGVMGFAEMLIRLGIAYASEEAINLIEELMRFLFEKAKEESQRLAKKRGSFPNFKGSLWEKKGVTHIRNASLITIAPTGSLSIIAGTSSGIEPLFAICYYRDVLDGTKLLEINSLFKEKLKQEGFSNDALLKKIAKSGSVQDIQEVPDNLKKLFQTAFDIPADWHLRIQSTFQKYTDNAVSKTINLPQEATEKDIKEEIRMLKKAIEKARKEVI